MSLNDELIPEYFKLCTDKKLSEIKKIKKQLKERNPKELKVKLAKEIVTIYHDEEKAEEAEQEFNKVFKEGELPSDIPEFSISEFEKDQIKLVNLLVKTDLASSKTEAKTLVKQGGIKIDGEKQDNWNQKIEIEKGKIIQRGKKKFIKLN